MNGLLSEERVLQLIHQIRNQKVMLDSDLAKKYRVPTKRLNEQVKRNADLFSADFMFQLDEVECENLIRKMQLQVGEEGVRFLMYLPNRESRCFHVFIIFFQLPHLTAVRQVESYIQVNHASVTLESCSISSVLNSPQAIHLNISITCAELVEAGEYLSK